MLLMGRFTYPQTHSRNLSLCMSYLVNFSSHNLVSHLKQGKFCLLQAFCRLSRRRVGLMLLYFITILSLLFIFSMYDLFIGYKLKPDTMLVIMSTYPSGTQQQTLSRVTLTCTSSFRSNGRKFLTSAVDLSMTSNEGQLPLHFSAKHTLGIHRA